MLKRLFNAKIVLWGWGAYFVFLFARMVSMRPDGLYMGHENLWSDWALHIGLAKIFADKSPADWFAYHPVYADGKLTYAFLTNLVSGLLMRMGWSLELAFILPSMLFSVLLVAGMHRLFRLWLGTSARAALAISIFLFSAGLGFLDYLKALFNGPFLDNLLPSRQFSPLGDYAWGTSNFIAGQLLPQRAFLLGMMLAVWAMYWVFSSILASKTDRKRLLLAALATGLLPIAHMHSLLALLVITGPMLLIEWARKRSLSIIPWFVVPAGLLAGVLFVIFVRGKIENPDFMSWHPGYTAKGFLDWLKFWIRAWGLMLPLTIAALVWLRKEIPRPLLFFYLGCFVLFAIANLVYFQPISWDNTKLFLWCYFGFSALAAHAIARLWSMKRGWRALAVASTIVLCFTGVLESIYAQRVSLHTFQLLTREELELADRIRTETGPRERFLTAADHNHLVTVWGERPILMGYTAWVWNYGFNYQPLERDISLMYAGGEGVRELLRKHRVSYVVIGPSERRNLKANEEFYRSNFPLRFETQNYQVFDVRGVLDSK